MHLATTVLLSVGLAAFAYAILSIRSFLVHRSKAKKLGCKPAPRMPMVEPLGIVEVLNTYKASREQRLPVYLQDRHVMMSSKHGRPVGTTIQRVFFRDTLFTVEPRNIQAILALQFKDFNLGVNRTENFRPLLGYGIFANNGKRWEHSRALLRPQFIRSQVSDLDAEETHVGVLLDVLQQGKIDNWTKVVDLGPLFFRLTLDTATEFLFGESTNTQSLHTSPASAQSEEALAFANAFDRSQFLLSLTVQLGEYYWLGHTAEFKRLVNIVNTWAARFVQAALDYRANPQAHDTKYGNKYIFLHALAKETQDPDELRSEVLNILLAGRDTTASLLSWFFYTMGAKENSHYYQRLRQVILEEFGTKANPKEITFESLKSCQYLQWCISETLRLYPVVPANVRTAVVDTSLPTGGGPDGTSPIYVKKGQDVFYSVHVMHRRKDLWGPDANEFKPDRWAGKKHSWSYLPFNGGPRICIGQQFALTEASYVIVRLIQHIKELDGSALGPVKHNLDLTNSPGDGVKLRLHFEE